MSTVKKSYLHPINAKILAVNQQYITDKQDKMIKKLINIILGTTNDKALKKLYPLVEKTLAVEKQYLETIKDQGDVLAKTTEFRNRLEKGETVDELLPEAFALVKIACRQLLGKSWEVRGKQAEWHMVPYDVQILGAAVLHQGNVAEMKTGEGKTLVCVMPAYLNALTGKGVFVVTVNNYLAQRDAEWMGGLFNYLGLSVGCSISGMNPEEKRQAYGCDITYGTNNEYGFDYLRDHMVTSKEQLVQRNLHYAIVDEVDSILIDEARTPIVISAPAEQSTEKYRQYDTLVRKLTPETHFLVDEKSKSANLTEEGIAKMEELMGVQNIYTEAGFTEVHHIEQALRAQNCFFADKDYLIKDNEIVIIDEFSGRLMPGRRMGQGLHQAIEAKENVEVKRESQTLATVTFQNYFRMFDKLAGMTGTAMTEAEEFYTIYGLDSIEIPPNVPVTRDDKTDAIYKNTAGKYKAAITKIKELHEKGQPVLVGTISVDRSESLSRELQHAGVSHNVLNAKNHEKEAEIIASAGQKGAITIATNMAGRGTDIRLGEGVVELGGLYILGTERHESRRIDNQLRGRSGRQGDPGTTQYLVSMEDELMRLFGGERMKSMMEMLKVPDDMPIENRMISKSIESAQRKVEGRNFDIRKHIVEYDDVLNIHRQVVYRRRKKFLIEDDIREDIIELIKEAAEEIVRSSTEGRQQKEWEYKVIHATLTDLYKGGVHIPLGELESIKDQQQLIEKAQRFLTEGYADREKTVQDPSVMRAIEKAVFLRANDRLWMEHIHAMTKLRENVAFSGYAQKNPLTEYKTQSYQAFEDLLQMIRTNAVVTLFKMDLSQVVPKDILEKTRPKKTEDNSPKESDNGVSVTSSTLDSDDSSDKVGRNDPCPCGSDKKYKKCCGKNE